MADSIPTDDQLLERYTRTADRGALDELARRYVDFVYGSARRQLADAHLAEDVTQAVFLLLMRKARSIPRGHLTGWLFNTTRYAAANARKIRARREHHEHLAAARKGETTMPIEPAEAEPMLRLLDDALAALGATDREALMLRYLQGREVAEISAALSMTEGTCRRRISRAVEKLRKFLGGKGVTTLEAGAVVGVLQVAGAEKAPAGVIISATATPAAMAIASGVATSMVFAKLKIAAVVMILLGGSVATMQVAVRRGSPAAARVSPAGDPRDAVRVLGETIFRGDSATARGMAVGEEQHLEILDALAAPAVAAAELNRALDARYGAGPPLTYNVDFGFRDLPERARFNIDGVVATNPNPFPLRMLKVENRWWVDTEHMSQQQHWVGSAVIARALAKSLDQVRAEVEEGLHPDRRAALSAGGRLSDESVRRGAATTRPLGYSLKVPGTMPAPELEADPRETVIAFAEAVRSGDPQKARELVYGANIDLTFIDSMAAARAAQHKLNQVVDQKFGAMPVPLVDLRILADWARAANRVFTVIRGDVAELPNPAGEVTIRLRAIDGQWRIDGQLLTQGRVDRLIAGANDRRELLDRVRVQVEGDLYPSREALAGSMIRQLNELRQRAAITRSMASIGTTINVYGSPQVERSDPRDVLREFAHTIVSGNPAAARRQAHGREDDLRLIDAYVRSLQMQSRVNRALDERYGNSDKPKLTMELFGELENAAGPALIRITRDRAELLNPDGQVPVQFVLVEDRWRIDMELMAMRLGREQLVLQPGLSDAGERMVRQIEAGGFVKLESARLGLGLAFRDARIRARMGMPPPATMPADELPADDLPGSQLDQSPRDVARFFAMAVVSGDWGVARLYAIGPQERLAQIDTLAAFALAQQKLNLQVNEKFGPSRTPLLNIQNIEDWVVRAPRGEQKIQQTEAELLMPGGEKPLRFRRVDGRWRIDVTDFGPKDASAMDVMARMLPMIETLRAEIAAGKFENRAHLLAEVGNRLQPLMAPGGATTRPATMPATMPVVDHSDPASVLSAFLPTVMTGDVAAARALGFGSDQDFALVDLLCRAVNESRDLDRLMDEKFGPGIPRLSIVFKEMTPIDKMQLTINGDEAEFTIPDGNKRRLRRINQMWKIDIADYAKTPGNTLEAITKTGLVMEQLRRDVESGAIKDRITAFTQIQKRIEDAVKQAAPATQP